MLRVLATQGGVRLGAELTLGYDILPLQGRQSIASICFAMKIPGVPDNGTLVAS